MLTVDFFIYIFLGYYLQNVLPHTYGIRKPFYYIFTLEYWSRKCSRRAKNKTKRVEIKEEKNFSQTNMQKTETAILENIPNNQDTFSDISKYTDKLLTNYRRNNIGFVFQNYNLIMHQTVLQNVELALTLAGTSKKVRHSKAIEVLESVGLIDHINKRPNELSGGQMQRVAIARALINDPDILQYDISFDEEYGDLNNNKDTCNKFNEMVELRDSINSREDIINNHFYCKKEEFNLWNGPLSQINSLKDKIRLDNEFTELYNESLET